jgi:hypothetical protein
VVADSKTRPREVGFALQCRGADNVWHGSGNPKSLWRQVAAARSARSSSGRALAHRPTHLRTQRRSAVVNMTGEPETLKVIPATTTVCAWLNAVIV